MLRLLHPRYTQTFKGRGTSIRFLAKMTSASPSHFDALILGSGQAGNPLANHIVSQGHSVCLVESVHIGGCCVNEGCTPTKTMVASGRIAYLARRAGDYGVHVNSNGGEVSVDMQKVRQRKRDIVTQFRSGNEKRLKNNGVHVLMGKAKFVGKKTVEVTYDDASKSPEQVTADKIFVNVGCRPSRPELLGLDKVPQDRVLDSTSVMELSEVPKHLVVLGGGVIGLEFGQLLHRLGAKVTIIQRGSQLLPKREDSELAECMAKILREEGLDILLDAGISSISSSNDASAPLTLTISSLSKTESTIHASHLLLSTGRVPNTDTLNCPAANIKTASSGHITVTPSLETNVPGIYALGDVKGGPAFTHVSYDDFRILRDALYPGTNTAAPRTTASRNPIVPSVTYTDPQLATVGTPLSALPSSKTYVSYSMPASWIARGLETDETRGMLKALVDKESGQIVWFGGIAVEAGEIMSVVQMGMIGGVGWEAFRDGVFAHPTWAECLNNLWGGEKREVKGRGK